MITIIKIPTVSELRYRVVNLFSGEIFLETPNEQHAIEKQKQLILNL